MTISPVYFFRPQPKDLRLYVNHREFTPLMGKYFKDFVEDHRIYSCFTKALIYVEVRAKSVDIVTVYKQDDLESSKLDTLFSRSFLSKVFSADLKEEPQDISEKLVDRVLEIFLDKIPAHDAYYVNIHMRLIGKGVRSLSSDHFCVKIDFSKLRLKLIMGSLSKVDLSEILPKPQVKISLKQTSMKLL